MTHSHHILPNTDANVVDKQDLCYAALTFASENLKPNGHFVCKFYQGAEDKLLQTKLKKMFEHVHREKPDSSRKVCISHTSFMSSPSCSFVFFQAATTWN